MLAPAERDQRITIILPTYSPDAEVTKHLDRCMDSLFATTPRESFLLLIVENGSHAASHIGADMYVRTPEALGYARAVNLGIKLATTDTICIINNDLTFSEGWLQRLYADYASVMSCAIMAPQESGGPPGIQYDSHWWSCVMTRKSVIRQVGILDETKLNLRYHDQDWNIRARKSGLQVCRTGNVIVGHANSQTYSRMNAGAAEGAERAEMIRRHGCAEFHDWVERHRHELYPEQPLCTNVWCGRSRGHEGECGER